MFNPKIIQQYAEYYNYSVEKVEKECAKMLDILVKHKYYSEEDAIKFIEQGMDISKNIKRCKYD
jgi:hypothetical protein